MKKHDEGFTLIELLIVIVILGILATVVVFSVRGITDDSQQNSCDTDQRTMQVAVEAYFAQYGGSAVTEGNLVSSQLVREASTNTDVSGTGIVGAQAGGDCVGLIAAELTVTSERSFNEPSEVPANRPGPRRVRTSPLSRVRLT